MSGGNQEPRLLATENQLTRADEKPKKVARRFVFVQGPGGKVKHLYYGKKLVEGEATACGLPMQAGWRYASRATTLKGEHCRSCERAGHD